ncbi:MAG: N-acetyltransferase [Syntrophales bacterium]
MFKENKPAPRLTVIRTSKGDQGQIFDLQRRIFRVNECFSRSQLRYLRSSPNVSFFLIRDNNSFVGFGIALRNKLRNGKYKGRIYSIGALPAYRSMGAGKLLLDAMEKYLIESNVSFIVLETLKGKGGAESFFSKHAYKEAKFLPNYYPYGDAVRMRKTVTTG